MVYKAIHDHPLLLPPSHILLYHTGLIIQLSEESSSLRLVNFLVPLPTALFLRNECPRTVTPSVVTQILTDAFLNNTVGMLCNTPTYPSSHASYS